MLTAHTVTAHTARETTMLRRLCSRANLSRARWCPTTAPASAGRARDAIAHSVDALEIHRRGGATRVAAVSGRAPLVAAGTGGRDLVNPTNVVPRALMFARTLSGWTPAGSRGGRPSTAAAAAAGESPAEVDVREVLKGLPSICPGCGVGLQCEDKNGPGFFVVPKRLLEPERDASNEAFVEDPRAAAAADDMLNFDEDDMDEDDDDDAEGGVESFAVEGLSEDELAGLDEDDDDLDGLDLSNFDGQDGDAEDVDEDAALAALDALFAEDDDTGDTGAVDGDDWDSIAARKREERESRRNDSPDTVVCARCYSLRNYGKVKNEAAEILMPSFDFGRVVGDRLSKVGPGGAVVLLLVDLIDFDGSFPVDAVDVISPYVANESVDVLLVGTKVDLLPTQCTRARVTSFVRRRAKDLGLKRASGVHLVSAHSGMGVNILSEQLETLLDEGREVWVVGAQNAGKSSLINRLSKKYGGPGPEDGGPLASHLPGTTLGVVKLPGLLPNGSDVYDTPGLLQPFQVSGRLTNEEARAVLPRKRLAPRTYRAEIGSSIHIGGLARIDVVDSPQRTLYLTVWASHDVPTHYMVRGEGGKADDFYEKHAGGKLSPPVGEHRAAQLGEWGCRTVSVYGESWQRSDRDISIGGLGWVGVGCNGNASFRVWTHEGVQVETRESLVPDMGRDLLRPGFSDEQQPGGGGDRVRPSKKIMRKGGYRAPKKKDRGFKL
jgi:ribosome biogenesis GTPase A